MADQQDRTVLKQSDLGVTPAQLQALLNKSGDVVSSHIAATGGATASLGAVIVWACKRPFAPPDETTALAIAGLIVAGWAGLLTAIRTYFSTPTVIKTDSAQSTPDTPKSSE